MTGSHYSAYEEHPWISNLVSWLHDFLQQDGRTKIVAVCFGSQVGNQIALMLYLGDGAQKCTIHQMEQPCGHASR